VGNPSEVSSVVPLVDKVQAAFSHVTTRPPQLSRVGI
jgi:hypothetical protein